MGIRVCIPAVQDQNVVACVSSSTVTGSEEYATKDIQ